MEVEKKRRIVPGLRLRKETKKVLCEHEDGEAGRKSV